jgi:acetyl/propionyl-CoA carboxylase alpha subunit
MKLDVKLDDNFLPVALIHSTDGYKVRFADNDYEAELRQVEGPKYQLMLEGQTHEVWLASKGDTVFVHALGQSWELLLLDPIDRAAGERSDNDSTVRAPMPGVVVEVNVSAGDEVEKGQPLLVIESMKLETLIAAKEEGVVETVHVVVGDSFDKDSPLVTMQEGEDL